MLAVRASSNSLKGLGNISWLTARQLDKLSKALTISVVEKRETIFDENHLPDSAYILLSGVARITSRNRKGQRTLFEREHLLSRNGRQLVIKRDRLESFLAQNSRF